MYKTCKSSPTAERPLVEPYMKATGPARAKPPVYGNRNVARPRVTVMIARTINAGSFSIRRLDTTMAASVPTPAIRKRKDMV